MTPPRTRRRGWQRQGRNPATAPAHVLEQLERRVLSDLDHCRVAWEHAGDPMALAVAVIHADVPEWLADALLCVLTFEADATGAKGMLARRWVARGRAIVDRHRATAAASAKALMPDVTWPLANLMGERLTHERFDDISHVDVQAMKKAYQAVCQGLDNPGAYYLPPAGFAARIRTAYEHQLSVMEAALAREAK